MLDPVSMLLVNHRETRKLALFPTISPMDLLEAKAKSRQIKSRQARAMLSGDRIETSDSSTCTGWSPQRKQDSECPS